MKVRRLACREAACPRQTFREQVPCVLERYSPRRATRLLRTRPAGPIERQTTTLKRLTGACNEMKVLDELLGSFVALIVPDDENEAALTAWIDQARAADLPRALLHPRHRTGPRRRRDRVHALAPQRANRGHEDQGQARKATDVRPRQLQPPTTPHPSRLTTPARLDRHRKCDRAVE